jgi:hypothetical protein
VDVGVILAVPFFSGLVAAAVVGFNALRGLLRGDHVVVDLRRD